MMRSTLRIGAALTLVVAMWASGAGVPVHGKAKGHPIYGYGWYTITCYFATGNLTASGTVARYGELAVDKRVIPLGSWVHIEGIGTFRAEDTGGLVWGRHLDVFAVSWPQAYHIQGNGLRKAYWWPGPKL